MGSVSILRSVASPGVFTETEIALRKTFSLHDEIPCAIRIHTAIAVAEVLANIVEHGGAGEQLVRIEMHITVQSDHLLVVLIDDGIEAHVDLGSACMPEDSLAERGRGLAMAQLALDRLTYQREAGLNYWTLASHSFGFVEAVA